MTIRSVTARTFSSGTPTILNDHYAIFVGDDIISRRQHNGNPNSVVTNLYHSVVRGIFAGIVHISGLGHLNSGIIIRNNAFQGSTILHTFRRCLNGPIAHTPRPKLVNTVNVTLLTHRRYHGNSTNASFVKLSTIRHFRRHRFNNIAYHQYGGHYRHTIITFNSNSLCIANGHYPHNNTVS